MSNILLAGPWMGEFGWEIMKWIPAVRHLVENNKYDAVICSSNVKNEYLYKDFCTDFIPIQRTNLISAMGWKFKTKNPVFESKIIEGVRKKYDINRTTNKLTLFSPTKENTERNTNLSFKSYGVADKKYKYDLLFHARWTNKQHSHNRDWSLKKWADLALYFKNKIRIASIGMPDYSKHIANTHCLLGIDTEHLSHVMKSSRLIIGPSSGPLHLASLCGLPHLVWTDSEKWGGIGKRKNRDRYETLWNPFKTNCVVLDDCNWQPQLSVVVRTVKELLKLS